MVSPPAHSLAKFSMSRIEANLVKQDGPENESKVTVFRLTDHGSKKAAGSRLENYLKAKLVCLGYPWPENLEAKSIAWLEAEISVITPAA